MHRIRVGVIAPPWFAVPPLGYGGVEWVVSNLTEGLVQRGHEVTLFASGGSKTKAKLVPTYESPPSAALGDWVVELPALLDAYRGWRDFDIIHDHTMIGLVAGAALPVPVAHTVHGPVIPSFHRVYQHVAGRVEMVAISHDQASALPVECRPTVIHNGVDTNAFPFREANTGEYLLFVGRMSSEKGILPAIEIARRAGMPLRILAKVNEAPEREYFERLVEPRLAGIRYDLELEVPHEVKVAAYQGALATLFPIDWPEPFGLVMTESMSCGTPVIAFSRGSVPEVIADGETGFLCADIDEAVAAVGRVAGLSRTACRQRVEKLFSVESNVNAYEALYMETLARRGLADSGRPAFSGLGGHISHHGTMGRD